MNAEFSARSRWERSYPPGVSWSAPLPAPTSIEQSFEDAVARWPERIAMEYRGNSLTYAQLGALAARAAAGLQRLGVGPGVNVGLHLANCPQYAVCFFGVMLAGGCVVNFTPAIGILELARQLASSGTRLIVTSSASPVLSRIAQMRSSGELDTVVICNTATMPNESSAAIEGDAAIDLNALLKNDTRLERHARGDLARALAVIQYTGGTTGDPKGAMLSHAGFACMIEVINRWESVVPMLDPARILAILPFSHVIGLATILIRSIALGRDIVVHEGFDPASILATIAARKIAGFAAVPAIYAALANHPDAARVDLSSLRICGSGGAPIPQAVMDTFAQRAGTSLLDGYALTETTCVGTWQIPGAAPRPGAVGLPLPHVQLDIVDLETGTRELPPGERGEVCFRGPHLMLGYWNAPEATVHAFRGGRFHTGDLGVLDEDGYLTLVGRLKEMILTGGHNVFPSRIEAALCSHPAIAEAAVIGIEDEELGQLAKAYAVLNANGPRCTTSELYAYLRDRLAAYELPVEIEFRDSLPRNGAGKISRDALAGKADNSARQSSQTERAP